jgi:hypothetical protein
MTLFPYTTLFRSCSYGPHLKRQSNEWKNPGSPRPKKVRPTQSNVKAIFIVAYDTAPHCPSKTDSKRCHFLHNHLHPALVGNESHHPSLQCKGSYCQRCHGSPSPLAMGDTGKTAMFSVFVRPIPAVLLILVTALYEARPAVKNRSGIMAAQVTRALHVKFSRLLYDPGKHVCCVVCVIIFAHSL